MALSIRRKTTYNTLLGHRSSPLRLPERHPSPVPGPKPLRHPELYPTPTQGLPRLHMRIHPNFGLGGFPRPRRISNHRERSTTIRVDPRLLCQHLIPPKYRCSHRPIILPVEERAMRETTTADCALQVRQGHMRDTPPDAPDDHRHLGRALK